ncbi:ribonucleoside triphosphate reductase [Candidatus Uhrbacteria bacterium]|nr:ribonucleoside triphosphate reductase [Candidatus Uhrbacteria bacterium]
MPIKVKKRDAAIAYFEPEKIIAAIEKAGLATGDFGREGAEVLASHVIALLPKRIIGNVIGVEEIQDAVEEVLLESPYKKTAKAYILYRSKRAELRQNQNVVVDVQKTIDEYLNREDWRVNANANQGYSLGGLILNTSGKVVANYWLSHVYPKEAGEAHRNGDVHIHDLDMLSGYCAGWSLRALLEEGFNGVPEKIESDPPKHLSSAVSQMVNFLGTLQNEWAGAQAFSSFDTYLAPFAKKYELELREDIQKYGMSFASDKEMERYLEDKVYQYVRQNIQSFVFNLNIPSRWGTQTPFTNITLDWICPMDLKDKRLKLGGKYFDYTFGELQKEMDIINQVFIEIMTKGDAKGRTFTFPIPTYNISKDFDWDNPKTDALFKMTAKYGTPYFQNFINSDLNPGDVRSMCCRLQLDLTELKKRGGGLFGSAEMTGSIGVITINAARIGYQCRQDKERFFKRMDYLMELSKASLEIKRKEVQRWMDQGLFPYTKRYLGSLHNHFSTIGINGLNEAIRNFTDDHENITTARGQEFALNVLDHMRARLVEFQEETGNLYNLEATPAEGATYRFAKADQKKFPGILQAGTNEAPYYTNSSQLPVGYTDDLFEAMKLQEKLQGKYTGGTVFHCYMRERISEAGPCRAMVRNVLANFRVPYITITPTFSICPIHGYLQGEYDFCPKCDEKNGIAGESFFDWEFRKKHTSKQAGK